MWIVRLALRRPYTIAVAAILIFLFGILSVKSMLVDIFPTIDIPVVGVIWSYPGLSAEEMEKRVVFMTERTLSTSVNGIQRIDSHSIPGVGLLRVYFQPGSDIGAAIAQISASAQTILRILPPGMQPPVILQFNASNVPVIQLTLSSESLPEEKIFDYSMNFIRIKLYTIPGLAIPAPYGGKSRQINVDIDPQLLNAKGLSAYDVVSALQASNLIMPAGSARIGNLEYNVILNSSPNAVKDFNALPVRVVGGAAVLMGDIAKISDSFADQTNIVRINGKRATYLNILKKADASTLEVVNSIKALMPNIRATSPKGLNVKTDFDQSIFVKAAIGSVLKEALIASTLVSLLILLFLGSWRSVIVVCTSIPLAILCSIIGLNLTGNSANIMTLGGLSLAIGMLVDDATVEVENIHRNRLLGKPLTVAILAGAQQIALPAIMATLAICIVFFPVVFLTGPARFLFTPMALAVVFAMLASYVLSRTLVPLLSRMLMANEKAPENENGHELFPAFSKFFSAFQARYQKALVLLLEHRAFVLWTTLGFVFITSLLPFIAGKDFFPQVDAGLMKMHFRAPVGTRIEETERLVAQAEKTIRQIIPPDELETINSMIGIPIFYNLAFVATDNIGGMDAELLISLSEKHHPTSTYIKKIREALTAEFPSSTIYFQPADIVNQVLNFGLSSPIDIQISGGDLERSFEIAKTLQGTLKGIPGLTDVHIKQVFGYPTLNMNVDRVRALQVGLSQRDVANSMLISLSSSSLVAPSYFLNPKNNVNYLVSVKVPLQQLSSVDELLATTITPPSISSNLQTTGNSSIALIPASQAQRLGNLVTVDTVTAMEQIDHGNTQRVVNIAGNVEDFDLGSVVSDIQKKIDHIGPLPPGVNIEIRGQGEVMYESFTKLGGGLLLAMVLVYLLMVILFQSWLDPFIVMVAVPGAIAGILWALVLTGTTINVESLMGSIMAVGIAASNSILLVSFANDVRVEQGLSAIEAALAAGTTRLRPVLMTALAMIAGMLPSALGWGEGGEQNAPLGRAVIGGLLMATAVTLLIVPIVYSLLRKNVPTKHLLDEQLEQEEMSLETSHG
jgi:multidrug efflux pump subunit AcrB